MGNTRCAANNKPTHENNTVAGGGLSTLKRFVVRTQNEIIVAKHNVKASRFPHWWGVCAPQVVPDSVCEGAEMVHVVVHSFDCFFFLVVGRAGP